MKLMSSIMLEPLAKINVRYYLDSDKKLVWFPDQVEKVDSDCIEVLFEGANGFKAISQSFIVKKNNLQDSSGELYPFKVERCLSKKTNVNEISGGLKIGEHQDQESMEKLKSSVDNAIPVMSMIGSNERLLSILSLKMNASIRTMSKHVVTIKDFGSLSQQLFSVSTDCSLQELDVLMGFLKARGVSFQVNPLETSNFPVQVSVDVGCFDEICSMMSISAILAEELSYSSKYNYRRKLIHCRFLGTVFSNQNSVTNPLLLCVGGSYWKWNDSTVVIVRSNQTQVMNRFISPLKIISSATEFGSFNEYVNQERGFFFGLQWKAFETETFCNAHRSKGSFYGHLKLLLPLVQVRNVSIAKEMDRLMGKQVSTGESSDDDSEETDQSD